MMYQSYLKDCNCNQAGIIIHNNTPVCRWCVKPYFRAGSLSYDEKDFQQNNKDWEIVGYATEHKGEPINIDNFHRAHIHSVLRATDNTTWTIGDETEEGKIRKFYIEDNVMWVGFEESGGRVALGELVRKRQPLFRTEDGKDVYRGDEYFYVSENFKLSRFNDVPSWMYQRNKNELVFSTEEAAKEYITMNKPCLSLHDIKWWLEKYFNASNGISVEHLKPLVQSKLDLK